MVVQTKNNNPSINSGQGNEEIKIKEKESSLSEFVKRNLPSEKEAEKFDNFAMEEAKEEEIEESLSEIYQDDKGEMVNVKKLDIKKGKGIIFWLFTLIFAIGALGGAAYAAYYYVFIRAGADSSAIQLSFGGKSEAAAGEELTYVLNYKNLSNVDIKNIEIKATYPDGFILSGSEPEPSSLGSWKFERLEAHRSGEIKIKGKIIAPLEEKKIILAAMTYTPANFSSEFKKEASFETVINKLGVNFSLEADSSVLVGESNEISVKYKAEENNFLNNFRLLIEPAENLELDLSRERDAKPGIWEVKEVGPEEKEIKIKYKLTDKTADTQDLVVSCDYQGEDGRYYKFLEKRIALEVVKNNLNLSLIVNGSRDDQGIDFGQTLNYSVAYANKGETEMKDIVVMAVLTSDILDWKTLNDSNKGQVSGNAISWSKNELPALASLKSGDEGIVDFSIKVLPLFAVGAAGSDLNLDLKYEVKSYAQFSVGAGAASAPATEGSEDTKSNVIVNKINSDLKLNEQVRYFNEDNIAVGSGPLPPKVGETTSFKVSWRLTNNLHELNDLTAETVLPAYVNWDDKARAAVGSLDYDSAARKVVWNIGRLPITVYEADAEFNISVTPTEDDRNKIMVLLSGTSARATDVETQSGINKTMPAKTTKLEDDDIAASDGVVE